MHAACQKITSILSTETIFQSKTFGHMFAIVIRYKSSFFLMCAHKSELWLKFEFLNFCWMQGSKEQIDIPTRAGNVRERIPIRWIVRGIFVLKEFQRIATTGSNSIFDFADYIYRDLIFIDFHELRTFSYVYSPHTLPTMWQLFVFVHLIFWQWFNVTHSKRLHFFFFAAELTENIRFGTAGLVVTNQ